MEDGSTIDPVVCDMETVFNAAVVLSLFLIVLVEKYVSELEVPPLVPIKLGLSSSLSSLNGLVPAPPPVDTFGESSNGLVLFIFDNITGTSNCS